MSTGELKVAYDHPDTVHQTIDWMDLADPIELRDLAHNLVHDLELVKSRLAVAYERLDALTTGTPKVTFTEQHAGTIDGAGTFTKTVRMPSAGEGES